jgi:aminobenzoyl-glutamate utilization protein B
MDVFETVERERERLAELAREIWDTPELALEEEESSRTLREALAAEGFDVETGIGGMPTAFTATYGQGEPRVGILGEFDALPGLSQHVSAEREAIEPGGPGHGCGHNLFGVACLGAAVAVKRAIDRGEVSGTVVYYGCPAEETLVGKVYMAREGAFDDLDAALTWHPGDLNQPTRGSTFALDSIRFEFQGVSAHAAVSPESGRSALDAVQVANTGVEYMREHLPEEARIHYSIPDGGDAPNVVPAEASVWYYVRAPSRPEVERISDWLRDVAAGAARMTRTDVEERYITGCYDYQANEAVTDVLWEVMGEVGTLEWNAGQEALARELQETLEPEAVARRVERLPGEHAERAEGRALYGAPVPDERAGTSAGSTEVGDVSYVTPTAQFTAATWPLGTPLHTWQAVAANGDFGVEGMVYAAKVLGGTAVRLLAEPAVLDRAREEFEELPAYESPLPEDATPPFDL